MKFVIANIGNGINNKNNTAKKLPIAIFSLLFVVFDVEAVFIFPWATQLERYGTFGLIEMGAFVFILLLGLIYAWRKGVLRWV